MNGEFWLYVEGQLDRTVVNAGDVVKLPQGKAKGFKMPDHGCPCYMLEYGSGKIPSVFPFGVVNETVTSTHDWPAAVERASARVHGQRCGTARGALLDRATARSGAAAHLSGDRRCSCRRDSLGSLARRGRA